MTASRDAWNARPWKAREHMRSKVRKVQVREYPVTIGMQNGRTYDLRVFSQWSAPHIILDRAFTAIRFAFIGRTSANLPAEWTAIYGEVRDPIEQGQESTRPLGRDVLVVAVRWSDPDRSMGRAATRARPPHYSEWTK